MRPLTWLLIRWPWTISLAGLEHDLRAELDQRALCAAHGAASPHQVPPPDWILLAAALLCVGAAFAGVPLFWCLLFLALVLIYAIFFAV